MTHILAATPAYGGNITIPFFRSFIGMVRAADQLGLHISTMLTHSGFVSRSRNTAAAAVIAQEQFTHLLTIDADMGWPPEALARFLDFDKDIVGATYPRRQITPKPSFIAGIHDGAEVVQGFARAEYVGCGFMLVKRSALLKMVSFYPERQHTDETVKGPIWDLFPSGVPKCLNLPGDRNRVVTDDVGFARLATGADLEIWADIALSFSHTGPQTFEYGAMGNFLSIPEKSP